MSFFQALRYLNSFVNYEKNKKYSYKQKIQLARIKDFLLLIGNPQKSLAVIHVAGSKGKGSTCAFIAYMLRAAGFSVGLYTSPHLHDFRERIRVLRFPGAKTVNGGNDFEGLIPPEALSALVKKLKPIINRYNRSSKFGRLTFFEVYTAIALLYFKQQNVDFVVLETGLGGKLDATNCTDSLVAVITPISYEHTDKLGRTLTKIATEKAGIIKYNNGVVISAPQKKEALKVLKNRCCQMNAKLVLVDKGIIYPKLKLRLLGRHQLINAQVAIAAVSALEDYGVKISASEIRQGIKNTRWPGRCEVMRKNPWVVLDGAQNLASAAVLKKAIKDNFKYKKLILVLGICQDKDIPGICQVLDSLADEIILTAAQTLRAEAPKKIARNFKRKVYLTENVLAAKSLALNLAGDEDLILVTGSLFVVGEFRNAGR